VAINTDVFIQEDISNLRFALHKELSNNMVVGRGSASGGTTTSTGRLLRFLTPQFIYTFFPNLPSSWPPSSARRLYGAESLAAAEEE
jgi:hypothetical protein